MSPVLFFEDSMGKTLMDYINRAEESRGDKQLHNALSDLFELVDKLIDIVSRTGTEEALNTAMNLETVKNDVENLWSKSPINPMNEEAKYMSEYKKYMDLLHGDIASAGLVLRHYNKIFGFTPESEERKKTRILSQRMEYYNIGISRRIRLERQNNKDNGWSN